MSAAPFVFAAMGTMVSLATTYPLDRATQDAVLEAFAELEDRFTLWRPDAEGARFARRELALRDASPEFRSVYVAAAEWRLATGGAFTPHRPDGAVDLSGIVKGLAIERAGDVLTEHGISDFCLNAGGDVLTAGGAGPGRPWVVGVVDPEDRGRLLSQITTGPGRRAVATSGSAERGEHVWRIGADATFTQVTVAADDIVTADVLATAILAGGPSTIDLAHDLAPIEVLAHARDGRLWASGAFLVAA